MKRVSVGRLHPVERRFPPHSCGGLIEAGMHYQRMRRHGEFSPAFVRGPH